MSAHLRGVSRNQRNPSAWSPDFSRFGVRNPESYAPASRKLNMQAPHRLKPGPHATSPVCSHWNDETQFIKDGHRTNSGAFNQGETVRLFYCYSARKQPPLLLKVAS